MADIFIEQIEIYQSRIKLKEPFVISLGSLEFAENIIVAIRTSAGISGFGECSPFKTIHGESIDTCFIVAQYLAELLKGKNPIQIEECISVMDKIIYGNASIKSAFDMALHDIAAQHSGMPLYKFLGGSNTKKLFTDYTVSIGEPEKMAADARKIKDAGFPVIKIKLGETKEKDVARIQQIREAVGDEIPLRIDANQGWTCDTAVDILNTLAPYRIQHCEEPIARWDYRELPFIRKQSPVPIMADESCCTPHDAKCLIDIGACDSFNIKLGKSGGIFNAMKIIQLADSAGIKMQAGGFLESRLGFTAAAHLALCSDNIIHFDFDTPLMFAEDHVMDGIVYGKNGLVTVPEVPGLGAKPDDEYLKKLKRVVVR